MSQKSASVQAPSSTGANTAPKTSNGPAPKWISSDLRHVVGRDVHEDVHRDRVGADDEEWIRPSAFARSATARPRRRPWDGVGGVALQIDDVVVPGEKQRDPAGAEHRPRRCPDALHDGAETQQMDHDASYDSGRAPEDEKAQLLGTCPSASQHTSRQQPEDHRRQRRNEVQRQVTAAVVDEGPLTRKEVEEPLVDRWRPGWCSCPSAPRSR